MFDAGPAETLGVSRGYKPIRCLGRGSFGTATLVQSRDGGLCVMKAIYLGNSSPQQREETVTEASVLASLKHPYVVRYFDGFIEDSSLAIITEFADGGDLGRRIEQQKQLDSLAFSEDQILRWLTQAALGLKYVHEQRIIHRDVKSQNLFLGPRGQILIGDFGICKVLQKGGPDCVTEERTIGTPLYFSPEVINRSTYSFASDVWALGCVLHELCLLRLPFEASNLPALTMKILRGTMPQLPAHFSAELRQILSDLLSNDAGRRPSCAQLLQKQVLKTEMRKMLREDQRCSLRSSASMASMAGPRAVSAPSCLTSLKASPSSEQFPKTPSGTLHCGPTTPVGVKRGPTTPSGALQRVASATLLQRPPALGQEAANDLQRTSLPQAWADSCSRPGRSCPSSRATSVGSGTLSRASSLCSLASSQVASNAGSRAASREARGLARAGGSSPRSAGKCLQLPRPASRSSLQHPSRGPLAGSRLADYA
eukprot:TRINITY_DN22691_c0_g1_i1.p1 TRINITY_DN22691_c0_g1~~TRINITY_DN22691_c0_g1_i1.p1  ORF type:complete len:521 (+),score=84.83 TRINITY_DN22691_c0_g1_i1:116-1564(+)